MSAGLKSEFAYPRRETFQSAKGNPIDSRRTTLPRDRSTLNSAAPHRTIEPHLPLVQPHFAASSVRRLPSRPIPIWLKSLVALQRSSSVIAFFMVGGVLLLYGQTVYTQQLWNQEYQKLEQFQRNERQLTATIESLKNDIAQQAERPGMGFVPPSAANTIYLQPTPSAVPVVAPVAPSLPAEPMLPMGY